MLRASTGALIWTRLISGNVGTYCSPALADGVLYFRATGASGWGRIFALRAGTGALVWTHADYFDLSSEPSVANGVVYYASDETANALDAASGKLLWSYLAEPQGFGNANAPEVANGIVYFGPDIGGSIITFDLPSPQRSSRRPNPARLHPNHALTPTS